ncbi:MAG: class I poly(R)-hydroxyalkanoic acid synthase [Gammaproteobacteria bacterium]|nr:MAG: class I poly(R)-hydroxyalkanoic acid synthase [Pseudomonadota bacterium]PIE38014.1 MAG: class I poly(R)-hydroxyalkanoic acid synthase [Gammaproteobacteria bacterium]
MSKDKAKQSKNDVESANIARKAVHQLFSTFDTATGKYRDYIEELVSKNDYIDDSQVATMFDMVSAYRDLFEQIAIHPKSLLNQEGSMLRQQFSLIKNTAKRLIGKEVEPVALPERGDRRFSDPEWTDNIAFDYIKQSYLIYANSLMSLVEGMEGTTSQTHDQFVFFTRQFVNALSPTNFVLTNPEVLRKTWSSSGANLLDGVKQFVEDYKKNPGMINISMTDFSAFRVGQNVATTPGKVVYQTELMQLIQYTPTTETVNRTPVLILPPWINKYYILDLTEKNSLVKWLVDQGLTVFMVSWINPGPGLRDKGFDDYMKEGALAALDAVEKATGEKQTNVIGYCVGGTLLACTVSYLEKKRRKRISSATYLTTLMDFSDPGGIGVFINEHAISGIERRLAKTGYYDGRAMAFSFNLLRENDLFWSFFINNYLKGEKPAAFDLLYWNSDSTNLPAKMHSFYLRNMYLANKLIEPEGIELDGVKIDLSKVKTPAYFLSTAQDHIAKWKTTYTGAKTLAGDVRFVLSGSGHIAGVVNPPAAEKYGYWTNSELPDNAQDWFDGAEKNPGSWWNNWHTWVNQYGSDQVPARVPGDRELEVIEDAPGTFVKQRIVDVIGQ